MIKREDIILKNRETKRIVYITTPNVLTKHVETFDKYGKIDLLVIDEGHKAKNIHTKIRKGLKELYVRK